MKSWPPVDKGTYNNPLMLCKFRDDTKSGKSSAMCEEICICLQARSVNRPQVTINLCQTYPKRLYRKYSAINKISWPCSVLDPRIFAPSPMTRTPQSACLGRRLEILAALFRSGTYIEQCQQVIRIGHDITGRMGIRRDGADLKSRTQGARVNSLNEVIVDVFRKSCALTNFLVCNRAA